MKQFISTSLLVALLALIISCNSETKNETDTDSETKTEIKAETKIEIKDFAGKWKKANVDSMTLVVEFTAEKEWNYFKNDTLVEKGTFEITEDMFIMKHAEEEHSHEGHEHKDGEEHKKREDHKYNFSLNAEKNELSLTHGEKTSVYNKL